MKPEIRAKHNEEMAFFKDAQIRYHAALDECGDIAKSLTHLKKSLTKLPTDKWIRLSSALRSGEITRGKPSTPGDWAAQELKIFKAALA